MNFSFTWTVLLSYSVWLLGTFGCATLEQHQLIRIGKEEGNLELF